MIQSQRLQIEIIRRIFENFGVSLDHPTLVHPFLINDQLLSARKLRIELESADSGESEEIVSQKAIWSAELSVADLKLRLMVADLSDEQFREFALVVAGVDMATFGIRLSDEPEDLGSFSVQSGGRWIPATIGLQATFLSGCEQLQGLLAGSKKPLEDKEIYSNLLSFLDAGDVV